MQIETEIEQTAANVWTVRAYWGFAFKAAQFATEAQAEANRVVVADQLESRIRAAQA